MALSGPNQSWVGESADKGIQSPPRQIFGEHIVLKTRESLQTSHIVYTENERPREMVHDCHATLQGASSKSQSILSRHPAVGPTSCSSFSCSMLLLLLLKGHLPFEGSPSFSPRLPTREPLLPHQFREETCTVARTTERNETTKRFKSFLIFYLEQADLGACFEPFLATTTTRPGKCNLPRYWQCC